MESRAVKGGMRQGGGRWGVGGYAPMLRKWTPGGEPGATSTSHTHMSAASAGGSSGAGSVGAGGESASRSSEKERAATAAESKTSQVVLKVGMVGDAGVGKTSLMVRYVDGKFDEDYIQTLGLCIGITLVRSTAADRAVPATGVNFMERKIRLRSTEVLFSIWDLGGQREFLNMLPLVCNDAVAILFMFDLSRKASLASIKEWYRQVRGLNKVRRVGAMTR